MSINRSFIVFLVSLLVLSGCATTRHKLHYTMKEEPKREVPLKVVMLPSDVTMQERSAGGVLEEVPEWSKLANTNTNEAIFSVAMKDKNIELIKLPALTEKEKAVMDEHIALYDVVAGSAQLLSLSGGPEWQSKLNKFDYTLGGGLDFLRKKTGADAALFLVGEDVVASSGRIATVIFAAMFGVGIQAGHSFLSSGLVDLKTGDILWLDYSVSVGAKDLREPEDAVALVKDLLQNYPTKDNLKTLVTAEK